MSFNFSGKIHSSKSLVNRLLILRQNFSELHVQYESSSDDVKNLEQLFEDYNQGKTEFFIGDGGTTFRFFCFWISMKEGVWKLHLGEQLARRPHDGILDVFKQVGIQAQFQTPNLLEITGGRWNLHKVINIDLAQSTQFLTGFLLAATTLKRSFRVHVHGLSQSSGYEDITTRLLQRLNFQIEKEELSEDEEQYKIIPPVDPIAEEMTVGADWSSIFYLSLFAFLDAEIKITNIDMESPEPDREGLQILSECGLNFGLGHNELTIKPSDFELRKTHFDFRKNPDLFPGFCALLAWGLKTDQEVTLQFPWQLKLKESDRLTKSLEFFKLSQLEFTFLDSETLNVRQGSDRPQEIQTDFDTAMDHRMFMSAMFLKHAGWGLKLQDFSSYRKSFPEFMEIIHG
ncbi:MAG: hypothetical protein M9899_08590 [Bdellovibrionaceae bacterium]|nr:hypothetical protein [Pseudobdellovibrionaceae bacterium]